MREVEENSMHWGSKQAHHATHWRHVYGHAALAKESAPLNGPCGAGMTLPWFSFIAETRNLCSKRSI